MTGAWQGRNASRSKHTWVEKWHVNAKVLSRHQHCLANDALVQAGVLAPALALHPETREHGKSA